MPRPLRGIFRKRRKLLHHLFQVAMESLRDWMRIRLDLPDGQLAAVAAVQTFGDCLVFHPHLHVLAATGLVDRKNRFHLMPVEKRRGIGGVLDAGEPSGARQSASRQPEGQAKRSQPGARQAGRANQTMVPLATPPQWCWTDEVDAPPAEWWSGVEPAWEAPELQLDEDWVLVLDGDPGPGDEWPV